MLNKSKKLCLTALTVSALLLEGCGSSSSEASPGSANIKTVSGVVFAESECAAVPVTVIAADGSVLSSTQTDGDGNYTASFVNPPSNPARVVAASCPNPDGSNEALVSLIPTDDTATAYATQTVNVNQLTNFRSALATRSGDPLRLMDEVRSGAVSADEPKQQAARDEVAAMLSPLVKAAGLAALDPVTTPMSGADRDRIAQVLAAMSIEFLFGADAGRIVQIRLKLAGNSAPVDDPVFRARTTDLADEAQLQGLLAKVSAASANVDDRNLPPLGMSELIDDLVARMNNCLPPPPPRQYDPSVKLKRCTDIFVDGDPRKYLHSGIDLSAASMSFVPMWIYGLLGGVEFSAPTYEYQMPDGIISFEVRLRYLDRSMAYPVTRVLLDAKRGADGKLGLSGNGYRYKMFVAPHAERRSFLNQPSSSYLSTGYSVNLPSQDQLGTPVSKVVITPPSSLLPNTSFTLLPGARDMVLAAQDGNPNETGAGGANDFVRMRSAYVDTRISQRHPSLRDTGQYFIKSDLSEDAIARIVPYAQVWKAEIHVGNSSAPEAVQYYRVSARPLTIAELVSKDMLILSGESQDMLKKMLVQDPSAPSGSATPLSGKPVLSVSAIGRVPPSFAVHGMRRYASTGATSYFSDVRDDRIFSMSPVGESAPGLYRSEDVKMYCFNEGEQAQAHCADASLDNYLDPADGGIFLTGVEVWPAAGAEFAFYRPREITHFLSVQQLLP